MKHKKRKYEKIHNRSKPRVASSAGDHWPGAQNHEQQLGALRSPDHDQQASTGSPGAPHTREQQASNKQAP